MDTERRNLLLQIMDEAERSVVSGNEISPEFARILFPPERKEYELTYYGKQNAQSVISNSFAAPIQLERSFGQSSDWWNKIIFGDNLQVLKILLSGDQRGN